MNKASFFGLLILVAASSAGANDKTPPTVKSRPGYQTIDLGEPPKPKPGEQGLQVTTSLSCKTDSGAVYKQGDAGYDTCVLQTSPKNTRQEEIQRQRQQERPPSP